MKGLGCGRDAGNSGDAGEEFELRSGLVYESAPKKNGIGVVGRDSGDAGEKGLELLSCLV